LVTLRSASHLSNMEQPEAFTRTVTTFLKRIAT
jgi:pimeloyl-ACP methyl ester carboxylesterase